MRIGIIGTGRMGRVFADALSQRDDVDVLVVGSRSGRADALAQQTGATAYDAVADLVRDSEGVVVAAATPAHPELVRAAVAAGVPVFCEKPLALDLATTDDLISEAHSAGVEIQVGFQRRFDPGYLAAQGAVARGEVGDVYLTRGADHDAVPGDPAFATAAGDIERDLMIHDVDITRFVTGLEITEILSMAAGTGFPVLAHYEESGDAGLVAGVVRFESGALGIFSGLRHHPAGQDVRLEVHGSRGSVVVGWGPGSPLGGSPQPHRSFLDRFGEAFSAEMEGFVELVAGSSPNRAPAAEARRSFAVAVAAERSRREQRAVRVDEVG